MCLCTCFGSCCTSKRFHNEGPSHSVLRCLWLCSFPEGSMCLSNTSTPPTHCTCWNSFPRVVKQGVLHRPDLCDARGLRRCLAMQRGKEVTLAPSLNHDFHRAKAYYSDEAPIFFYFTSCSFGIMFKNSLPNLGRNGFLLCFLLKILEFYILYLDLLSF